MSQRVAKVAFIAAWRSEPLRPRKRGARPCSLPRPLPCPAKRRRQRRKPMARKCPPGDYGDHDLDPAKTYGRLATKKSNIEIDGRGAWLVGPVKGSPNHFRQTAILPRAFPT